MLTKALRTLFLAVVVLMMFGPAQIFAQQLPSSSYYEKLLKALAADVEKSTSSVQSSVYQSEVYFDKDLGSLKMGDEVTLSISLQNISSEPITGLAALINFPYEYFVGPPTKITTDGTENIYGFYSSIGDHFGIKSIDFTHGQFYNTSIFGINKQAELSEIGDQLNDHPEGYGIGPINGIPPVFIWLLDQTTKDGYIAPGETAVLQMTMIAEMPTMYQDLKAVPDAPSTTDHQEYYTFNTAIVTMFDDSFSTSQIEYDIDIPDSEPDPVSFYMTSVGLESSDAGNTAGYYLTIVNRDFSSTLLLDLQAVMPQDFFVEFFKPFGFNTPPAMGFSTYHSYYTMYSPINPFKSVNGHVGGNTQNEVFSSYPQFNYALFQPEGQSNLQMSLENDRITVTKTASLDDIVNPGIVMPPGIMTIFIQGTPMPNGNGTTMTMEAQLDFIDSYEFEPPQFYFPPFPGKAVAIGEVEEHLDPYFPFNESASFDVSPIVVTYEAMNDSCPVNGDEIAYTMTVQGIDYPRLPGHFSIFQTVDGNQDVTLLDFQRPIELDGYLPSTTALNTHLGNEGGLLYTYERFSNNPSKLSSDELQDHGTPIEDMVINYVNSFQVLVKADVSATNNAMAMSEARLNHYLDLSEYYYYDEKSVSATTQDHEDIEIPGYVPDGFIFDRMFSTEVEANCPPDISGVKYLDINGNGTRDNGEPGIGGVEIQLVNLNNEVVATTTTAQDGSYLIENVPPAYYALREVVPAGYAQSEPGPINSLHHSIQAVYGMDLGGLNFGNYQPSNVQVLVFHDYNQNGTVDDGEPTLPDWDLNLTQAIYQYDETISTNDIGLGVFTNLRPGTYQLQGELPEYWIVTTADEPFGVNVDNNSSNVIWIGRYIDEVNTPDVATASIRGNVFNDSNSDSRWVYPGESGVQGRTIVLTGVSDKGAQIARTTTTNEFGRYEFTQLPPGMYEVSHNGSNGISSTWPKGGSHILRLEEGETLGSWASGGPGGAGWLQSAIAGDDSTPAVMSLLLDLDGDGAGDSYLKATGRAKLTLAGTTGMTQRPFILEQVVMYGRDSGGSPILLATPGIAQDGGALEGSSAVVGQELAFGLVIEIDGQYSFSTGSMAFEGETDRWPIRNAPARFNTMQNATPADLRDPFGQVVGSVLFAEITPLFGIDFGAEHADFGDAALLSGTTLVGPDAIPQLSSSGTVFTVDGARHSLPISGPALPLLGGGVTADLDGKPTEMADGDTDDGVVLPQAVAPGATFVADVTVFGAGYLSAWIDWNNDKLFGSGEQVFFDEAITTDDSPYEVTIAVPAGTADGTVFVRFRLSTQQGLGAYGPALDGEVEDYVLTIDGSLAGGGGGLPTNDPDDNAGIPTEFRLIGAWPNPFNPTTNISFDLPESASVRIEVVDMLGRQVMSLAPRTMGSGANRTITLDAAKLSSGVYIYRVVAETAAQTYVQGGKFTLVK